MTIKSIIFDADDTLLDTTRANRQARWQVVEQLAKAHGEEPDEAHRLAEDRLYKAFSWARLKDLWRALSLEKQWKNPEDDELDELLDLYSREFFSRLCMLPTVKATLQELIRRGIPIGIISNGETAYQWKKLRSCGVDAFFREQDVIISIQSDLEYSKPSTRNFREFERRFGLKPEELAYVGDKPWDVLGANTSGWLSVRTREADPAGEDSWPASSLAVESPDITIFTLSEILEFI